MTEQAAAQHLGRWQRFVGHVTTKSYRYWTTALIVFLLAVLGSHFAYQKLGLSDARDRSFQKLLEWAPRPVVPRFVVLVLIGDVEYWRGELAGRRPVKRDYLARIVEKLVAANVHVIALDFDVRLPNPPSDELPAQYQQDYQAETKKLIAAIKTAAQSGKKVVLATPIAREGAQYHRDPDIYQINGLCRGGATERDPAARNVSCGYIALPYDPLVIPGQLRLDDDSCLDSFALAIARAERPALVANFVNCQGPATRYANYIASDKFVTLPAKQLLEGSVDPDVLAAKTVIVGAHWSSFAAGRGRGVDLHPTPVGQLVGATLHANYVEAFLDSRIFAAAPDWILRGLEAAFGVLAAILFAGLPKLWQKLAGIVGLIAFLFAVQWGMLRELGVFFDALVPIVGLGLHSLYDRLFEARAEAV